MDMPMGESQLESSAAAGRRLQLLQDGLEPLAQLRIVLQAPVVDHDPQPGQAVDPLRCFGLRRCTWQNLPSLKAYV
jgi:hypothetical protein